MIEFEGQSIYHIGSTAIPGAIGRPCIDFAAVIDPESFDKEDFV